MNGARIPHLTIRTFIEIGVLSAIYFLIARWGLQIGAVSGFATLVWPPTGISLAALLLLGFRVWPGIALAAFFVNWSLGAAPFVALGMAAGNTLEALIGAYLLRRVGFDRSLERTRDVFALVVLAGFVSTFFSATIGVGSLFLGGAITPQAIAPTWTAWWFGDMLGDLLVAPFLLVWSRHPYIRRVPISRVVEIVALLAMVVIGAVIVLTDDPSANQQMFPHPYLIFPLLMILAVRLNQRWTVTAILITAMVVIWITTIRRGHFWTGSLSGSLLQAQIFLGVLAVSKMVLSATVMERKMRESEAQEAIQARDEFLSIASHELKTPLTSLYLQLQMFNRTVKKSMDETAGEIIALPKRWIKSTFASEEQVRKLSGLLDGLLDLTRIRSGKLKLEKENVDLCALVNEVVDRFRAEMAEAATAISVRCTTPAGGTWDRLRIEQVASNLISNALKYGEGRPISVVVKNDGGPLVRFIVQDQGMGIPTDLKDKIFERFERGRIRANQVSGLGLGLYICRQIVEAHGGTIGVESQMGKGSTFYVELPNW